MGDWGWIIVGLVVIGGAFWWWQHKSRTEAGGGDAMRLLQDQMARLNETLDRKLTDQAQNLQQQWRDQFKIAQDSARDHQKILGDVTKKLTELERTNQDVKNFAEQLKKLESTLTNPKQRGVLGEYFLEETLKNVLPPNAYAMQYPLGVNDVTGSNLIVDAAVFVKEKIIPIDSKFSLENYQRLLEATDDDTREKLTKTFKHDLKNRIDETSKYIHPERGTMDFAFMFIPSESIYYDLLVNKVGAVQVSARDLIEYAFKEKHVIIVSPTSFLAYLQTVLQGLRALQIEESAIAIRANVEKLGHQFGAHR